VVAQRRLDLLLGGEDQLGVVGQQVEQLAEVADGQELGDVGTLVRVSSAAISASSRCSAASSAAGAISTARRRRASAG
jgi:hypothetical protein